MNQNFYIDREKKYGANNYKPLPVVIQKAEGIWVEDIEGKKYMDFLSAYSSVNQGHRHPKIIQALKDQADKLTITSRAFYNDKLADLYELVTKITGKEKMLPMNTGAEAVETAVKMARKWGYEVKKIPENQAEIVVSKGNFHGRTTTITSFSSEEDYRKDFGPFTPGFPIVTYGDIDELEKLIENKKEVIAAILLEPIQGEAGIVIPKAGYLKRVEELCKKNNILFMADEIQTGFGRTGKLFASEWESVEPDVYILGKAMGGGVFPVSAVAADKHIMDVFTPGIHGSTFGGNPLACAVAVASIEVIINEKLTENSRTLGDYLLNELKKINSPVIKEVRGKGLFIGIELDRPARGYCEALKSLGILCKETHKNTIRLAPPLIIKKEEIDEALEKIKKCLA